MKNPVAIAPGSDIALLFKLCLQALGVRRSCDAFFGDDGGDEVVWRDVEGVVRDADALGSELDVFDVGDFARPSFLDRDLVAGWRVRSTVDSGAAT